MKSILGLLVLMTATSAFARVQYVCQEQGNRAPRTMILTQISTGRIQEGVKYVFGLELRDSRTGTVLLAERVNVETEDVMFSFSNRQRTISGMIYLDELDQTWLEIGRNKLRFDCGAGR